MFLVQDKLRDVPLQRLKQPILFVRGTRDTFCESEQFEAVLPSIPSTSVEVLLAWHYAFKCLQAVS